MWPLKGGDVNRARTLALAALTVLPAPLFGADTVQTQRAPWHLVLDSSQLRLVNSGYRLVSFQLAAPNSAVPRPFDTPIGPLRTFVPSAAVVVQQALALAEDNPQNHYDVMIDISGDQVRGAKVYATPMRNDPGVKRGDEICFWSSVAVGAIPAKIVRTAIWELCRANVIAPAVVTAGVLSYGAVLPAAAAAWVTAAATVPICWLAAQGGGIVTGAAAGGAYKYACNMIRPRTPLLPKQSPTFPLDKEEPLPSPKEYAELTDEEAAWRRYRDSVDYLKNLHEDRIQKSEGGLPLPQKSETSQYRARVSEQSDQAFAIRGELKRMTNAWLEANKSSLGTVAIANNDRSQRTEGVVKSYNQKNLGLVNGLQATVGAHRAGQGVDLHAYQGPIVQSMFWGGGGAPGHGGDVRKERPARSGPDGGGGRGGSGGAGAGRGQGGVIEFSDDEAILIIGKVPHSNGGVPIPPIR